MDLEEEDEEEDRRQMDGFQHTFYVVLPKFSSEPKFEPEPLGPNSKFSSRFRIFAELNLRSSSRFSQS